MTRRRSRPSNGERRRRATYTAARLVRWDGRSNENGSTGMAGTSAGVERELLAERRLAEHRLGPRAVDLDLGDVLHVVRQRDRHVAAVLGQPTQALDAEPLQQEHVAVAIDHLP